LNGTSVAAALTRGGHRSLCTSSSSVSRANVAIAVPGDAYAAQARGRDDAADEEQRGAPWIPGRLEGLPAPQHRRRPDQHGAIRRTSFPMRAR
jgi:hypothetical protein